jgi:hypothetical protein
MECTTVPARNVHLAKAVTWRFLIRSAGNKIAAISVGNLVVNTSTTTSLKRNIWSTINDVIWYASEKI